MSLESDVWKGVAATALRRDQQWKQSPRMHWLSLAQTERLDQGHRRHEWNEVKQNETSLNCPITSSTLLGSLACCLVCVCGFVCVLRLCLVCL